MPNNNTFVGNQVLKESRGRVSGEMVDLAGKAFYKITHYDTMPPFFMSIISDSDLWMFISSNGALTAGRKNPDNALFPYYTDDKIHDAHDITGSRTIIRLLKESKTYLWQPFADAYQGIYDIERNIYKNLPGNHLLFEEINHDLKLTFSYSWRNCERYGFVRKARIINNNRQTVSIAVLDGIQNILPADVEQRFQNEYSTLADGYKKNELHPGTGLAAYRLSSIPTDKAEPSESLRANTVWSAGFKSSKILLSGRQLNLFRRTGDVEQERDSKGQRGAYFIVSQFGLADGEQKEWYIVADLNKDQSAFVDLTRQLQSDINITADIENEIQKDNDSLQQKLVRADGLQLTSDKRDIFRHCANTLFNILRGGIFDDGYYIDKNDLRIFIEKANKTTAANYTAFIEDLPQPLNLHTLEQRLQQTDATLQRISLAYLPLTFGRRHGDPSRPWNRFSIDIKDKKGNKKLDYQGNWRDIFQNWEALALSYPEYIERMIVKFLNASTADGYNPYRVTRDGFDWEVIDPNDPWSHIGYWGDHQIIYLLKLLELSQKYHPAKLQNWLSKEIFSYANVPYRIKSYKDIINDPHNTIDFDAALDKVIRQRADNTGEDGKLLANSQGQIILANLLEKWLISFLVKLSNFIPEAGIWMNTQRPEWNDANNALVGYGSSMVTLYYMRRFSNFALHFFEDVAEQHYDIAEELFDFFENIAAAFNTFDYLLKGSFSDVQRKQFLDHVGQAGSDYRATIYNNGFSGRRRTVQVKSLRSFLQQTLSYLDHSIKINKRADGLYHSYNLLHMTGDAVSIRHLYEMLEGQVAVLSSSYLSVEECVALLDILPRSALFREDQHSYMLYPERDLECFEDRNNIPKKYIEKLQGLSQDAWLMDQDIVKQDSNGDWHFSSNLRNGRLLKETLTALDPDNNHLSTAQIKEIIDLYEAVFDHQSFTGRSATFYKYEGLGSIYWHMVSKLLLAVQEIFYQALEAGAEKPLLRRIKGHYYDIRAGIGSHKQPDVYGAFPTDPYSHTPAGSGVQQPGMTGQVKEDVISRFGELGVIIADGKIRFNPLLLNHNEFLTELQVFEYFDVHNSRQSISLDKNMLAFTLCQVPVIYVKSNIQQIIIKDNEGRETTTEGLQMSSEFSKTVFNREGKIREIIVMIKNEEL